MEPIRFTSEFVRDDCLLFAATRGREPVAYAEVLELWQHDEPFRSGLVAVLASCPFAAYRWETPPITTHNVDRPFEFVLLDSPWLAGPADAQPFAEHFSRTGRDGIAVFESLGRDALLVAPSPQGPAGIYTHLAQFVRHAQPAEADALWRAVGRAAERRLSDRPLWISTAGGGVAWLHVRLDSRPKYYGHGPFRVPP